MIIGKECGEMKTYYGQKGAHERVLELKYNNCKVVISNVDVQASSYGSIVIQVLGELSSDNEPAQRFAQTFVLCEQERGFFILNDIFRFLKDTKSDAQGVGFVGVVIEDGEFKVVNLSEKEPAQFNGSAPKSSSDVSEVTSLKVEPSTPVGETPIEPIVASNREVASTIPDQISEAIPTQDSVLENPLKTTTTASSKKLEGEASSLSTECRPIEADAIKNDKIESKPVGSKFTRSTNSQIKANSALKSSWANLAAGRLNNADAAEANLSQSQDVSPKEVQQSSSTGLRQKTKAPRETYKGYNYTNSVCIRGLKEPISKEPVMEVFSKFGTIKNLDVSNHLVFIEYEEQEGCAKALANPDTAVGEEKILVEARRPKNNSRNPGNRRGRKQLVLQKAETGTAFADPDRADPVLLSLQQTRVRLQCQYN
ncbi:hypothetical protein L0F63_001051 [Massospora cicadina]|nr:hypothetical protein L0F63_001051 [Massospora cicadina]